MKYRNALLVAAVASVAVGCGGSSSSDGGGKNPLSDPDNVLITGIEGSDPYTHRALAQLLGGAFYELINTTSTVFKSVQGATNTNGTMGKVIGPVTQSVKPTAGLAITPGVECSEGGRFDAEIAIEFDGGSSDLDLEILSEQPIDAGISFTYNMCDEPTHASYIEDNDPSTTNEPVFEFDVDGNLIHSIYHGVFAVSFRTTTGVDNNADDYSISASIEMKDYFIQRYSEGSTPGRPDILNGKVDVSLVTVDGSDYVISLSTNLTNNNNSTGKGFVNTSFLADGEVTLTDEFAFEAYDLSISGTIRDFSVDGNSDYQVYSLENLIGSGSDTNLLDLLPQPSQGKLAITTRAGDASTATVTETGLYIESLINGVAETSTCTWAEINDNKCGDE